MGASVVTNDDLLLVVGGMERTGEATNLHLAGSAWVFDLAG
jgi:hypothetical protein